MNYRLLRIVQRFLLSVIFSAIMLLVLVRGIVDPLLCYDPWAYHLRFAALLWDIGQSVQYTTSSPRFEGFGLVANWFQGLFWVLFGSANFVALTNFIPFCLMLFLAHRWFGVSVPLAGSLLLAMPLVSIHITSGYIDLFIASFIAITLLSCVRLLTLMRQNITALQRYLHALIIFFISASFAANSKFQAVALVLWVIAFFLCRVFKTAKNSHVRSLVFLACLLSAVAALGTNIKNSIVHHNPFYPVEIRAFDDLLWLDGKESISDTLAGVPLALWQRPFYFFLSVTEFDYVLEPLPKGSVYSEASQYSGYRLSANNRRLGGVFGPIIWFGLTVVVIGGVLLHTRRLMTPVLQDMVYMIGALTIVTMWLPNSYELRYTLVWPVMLCILVAAMAANGLSNVWPRFCKALPWYALLLFVIVQFFVPLQRTLWPDKMISYYPEDVVKNLDPVILDKFRRRDFPCVFDIKQPYDYDHFKSCDASIYAYAPAFTREAYYFYFYISGDNCQPPQ